MPTPTQVVKSNTLTTTIAATTGGGTHALIVVINSFSTTTPSVTSVDLGATALTSVVSKVENTGGQFAGTWQYLLTGIANGQTTVTITGSNLGVTSGDGGICILEVPAVTGVDTGKTNTGGASSATYSSGSTGALSQSGDFVVGTADADAPASPAVWTNTTDAGNSWVTGYQTDASTTALTFTDTCTAGIWSACIAAYTTTSAINVALPVAQVNVAGFALQPSINVNLPVAQVNVTAHPIVSVLSVFLPVAQVGVTAHPLNPAYSPVALFMALTSIAAADPIEGIFCQIGVSIFPPSGVRTGVNMYGSLAQAASGIAGGLFGIGGQPGDVQMSSGQASGTDVAATVYVESQANSSITNGFLGIIAGEASPYPPS
jgi:hypothetical protein